MKLLKINTSKMQSFINKISTDISALDNSHPNSQTARLARCRVKRVFQTVSAAREIISQ